MKIEIRRPRECVAVFVAMLVTLGLSPPASAQHAGRPLQPAATELYPGVGNYHFPIATANPEAQVYFDNGIGLLYGFNHDEAARYFRRAAELDPKAPMPYWGLAMSIGPNYNDTAVDAARAAATFEAVKNAQQREAAGSERERAYIDALAKRYPSPEPLADWLGFHRTYSDAMRAMVAKYPDDLDAATMFAESLMMLRRGSYGRCKASPRRALSSSLPCSSRC